MLLTEAVQWPCNNSAIWGEKRTQDLQYHQRTYALFRVQTYAFRMAGEWGSIERALGRGRMVSPHITQRGPCYRLGWLVTRMKGTDSFVSFVFFPCSAFNCFCAVWAGFKERGTLKATSAQRAAEFGLGLALWPGRCGRKTATLQLVHFPFRLWAFVRSSSACVAVATVCVWEWGRDNA